MCCTRDAVETELLQHITILFTFIEAESDHTFEEGNKRTDLFCISAGKKHHLLLNIHAPKVLVKAKNKVFIRISIRLRRVELLIEIKSNYISLNWKILVRINHNIHS